MNKPITIVVALAFLLLIVSAAHASDDMDLLQALDVAMEAEQEKVAQEEDRSFMVQAVRNGESSVRLRGYHTFRGAQGPGATAGRESDLSYDTKDDYGEIKVSFGTSYENDLVRMAAAGWLEHGNQDDTYSGNVGLWQDADRRRNFLEINELYVTLLGDKADLTLGKRLIDNSISPTFSPGDRYSSFDLNDPLDPRRLGAWQVALEGDAMDVSWMVAVLPVFQAPRTPSPASHWTANGAASEELFFFEPLIYGGSGFSDWLIGILDDLFDWPSAQVPQVTVEYDVPEPGSIEATGLFGQAKTSVANFDFLVSVYRGPSLYPVLRVDLDRVTPAAHLVVEHPTVNQFTGGVSTPWKGVTWHAEAIYSHSEAGKDDSYVQYAVGATRSEEALAQAVGLWRIDVGLQYAGEWITDSQDAAGYAISSNELRVGKNDLMSAVTVHCTEDVRLHYLAILQLDHGAAMNRVGVEWDVTEHLASDVSLEFFDGPLDSYFGWWRDRDRVVATLTYTF